MRVVVARLESAAGQPLFSQCFLELLSQRTRSAGPLWSNPVFEDKFQDAFHIRRAFALAGAGKRGPGFDHIGYVIVPVGVILTGVDRDL
jgi:hypothetical protein